ncbi:MAG: ATP-binding cassette domain-containing protein [Oscillospiraceae bacterium]|nr:ATP-binding cassette domain-containing protein [Oscillospiraceae bacterium]
MKPAIILSGVTKSFRSKKATVEALRGIDLTVESGQIFGVIGLSGAGKSTLVRCINQLEKPTSGEVYVNGQALSGLKRSQLLKLRRSIGMIFQHFNLLNQRTALGNVRYPLEISGWDKDKATKKALELLDRVGIADKANAYPAELSGGQKQRVAIARALANDPSILLCDEATSALDPATTFQILKLIKDLSTQLGLTVVIITHEMLVVKAICSHFALVEDGVVKYNGVVDDDFEKIVFNAIGGSEILELLGTKGDS